MKDNVRLTFTFRVIYAPLGLYGCEDERNYCINVTGGVRCGFQNELCQGGVIERKTC
jgi:hypothetical protein